MKYDDESLDEELPRVQHFIYLFTIFSNVFSSFLTGGNVCLYLLNQGAPVLVTVLISLAVGLLTLAVLIAFTTAFVKLLPRLRGYYLATGGCIAVLALIAILTISGTSNANILAYWAARTFGDTKLLAEAERALAAAEDAAGQFGQIVPIMRDGRTLARTLKERQREAGQTGPGKGPIFDELLIKETRLTTTEETAETALEVAAREVRAGGKLLEEARAAQKDSELSSQRKRQIVETAAARVGSHVIAIRQALPIAALHAAADMLRKPITLATWSSNPRVRRMQEEEVARLHKEFEPIGLALQVATDALAEGLPEDAPAAEPQSPFALGQLDGDLWWIAGLGYAVDSLGYLALGLVLVAHAQLRRREERRQLREERIDDRRAGNGIDREHINAGRKGNGRRRPDWRE